MLQSERITLRKLKKTDAEFIIQLLNTPGWLKYIGDRNVTTIEQAVSYIENGPLKSYEKNGFGLYAVELNEGGITIGVCGLIRRDYLSCPDIGFAFLPEYNGKGYAHESACLVLKQAKEEYGIGTIQAITVRDNYASIRLLEKLGMKFENTISDPGTGDQLLLFEMNQDTEIK
jgi:[ribosomal protein S5]-alanine N-acetyltransferase